MFKRSFRSRDQTRVDKSARPKKSGSVRDPAKVSKLQRSLTEQDGGLPSYKSHQQQQQHHHHHHHQQQQHRREPTQTPPSVAPSPIVTLTVGREGRLFAAHEDVLTQAPFFEAACRGTCFDAQGKRIALLEEDPEVFSAVLEYLYKGDYYPRLIHNRHRNSWDLEDRATRTTPHTSPHLTDNKGRPAVNGPETVVYLSSVDTEILRDTVIYCAAERYGLEELKRLALRKQGLQSGIDVGTILRSAQYAYANTPDNDSQLRAHYLALIIRCRKTFKRSGTMQAEMEAGGSKLYFDLFVALCNHVEDIIDVGNARTPKTV